MSDALSWYTVERTRPFRFVILTSHEWSPSKFWASKVILEPAGSRPSVNVPPVVPRVSPISRPSTRIRWASSALSAAPSSATRPGEAVVIASAGSIRRR